MGKGLIFGVLVLATGCGDDGTAPDEGAVASGQTLYEAPHDDGNTFACATCHALEEPGDGLIRPGHPIGDAAQRATFKNGQLTSMLDAVNTCRDEWMGAPAFAPDDERWQALEAFLVERAGDAPAEPLTYAIADPPADVTGGDAVAGMQLFDRSCVVCHGAGGTGTERAPAIAGTPEEPDAIALKIRRSGSTTSAVYPDLIPGRMPFWAEDRLSDDEVRDLVAFLAESEPIVMIETPTDAVDLSQPGAQTGCAATHPLVGQTLTFATKSHAVAGTATVVDDCTIRFDDFSFDGGGIDVRIYGGTGGNYDLGPSLSVNMVGTAFDGGSAVLSLPPGITLDAFDGLSVWCVPVGFSFGDGVFE